MYQVVSEQRTNRLSREVNRLDLQGGKVYRLSRSIKPRNEIVHLPETALARTLASQTLLGSQYRHLRSRNNPLTAPKR